VQLTVNGVPFGPPVPLAGHVHTWTGVTLTPGVNTIEVTGTAGATPVSDTVRWTLR
jgi:beta-galactosidase